MGSEATLVADSLKQNTTKVCEGKEYIMLFLPSILSTGMGNRRVGWPAKRFFKPGAG